VAKTTIVFHPKVPSLPGQPPQEPESVRRLADEVIAKECAQFGPVLIPEKEKGR
jgi:hypothetical protein